MPTTFESTGNRKEIVDSLMSDLQSTIKKNAEFSTLPSAKPYTDILLAIINESSKAIHDCQELAVLQVQLSQEKDMKKFVSQWKECTEKFTLIHATVASDLKRNRQIPTIPDILKAELPSNALASLENIYKKTVESRTGTQTAVTQVHTNHKALSAQVQKINARSAEQRSASAGASQPPLSSSYGAQNAASKVKAEQANANRADPNSQNNQPGAKR